MITDERAEQGRVRLSHRLRDFLGIVPDDEIDALPLEPALLDHRSGGRATQVRTGVPVQPAVEPRPETPVVAKRKRRAVAGPHTAAERARLREIVDDLRAGLGEAP